ncbi:MAG: aldehyde dehydrogenase family protein [Candidatus Marinimicrobia bacterium]|nr:aldehyde dehydrogenase family protein [Candidatus Neomarinimicrobiota bacterium]
MKMLLAGEWITKNETINIENPYDQTVVDTVPRGTADDMKKAIDSAEIGAVIARKMPVHQRMDILYKTAEIVKKSQEEFARTIASEGSKTIKEARGEASRCVNTLMVSAEESRRILGETLPFDSVAGAENKTGYYKRVPIGIIGAITPFNDPLNLVAHKLGPAIAGGNSVVLKPATVTPLSALKLAEAFMEAGLPAHVLNVVTGYASENADALVTDPRVRMVSFTGGVDAGENVMSKVGLKKIGMELGSNSPVIVMDDADVDWAVESCVSGAFWAVGQNCIGVQRILIQGNVYEEFTQKFVEKTKTLKVGRQLDESTDVGPMITIDEAERVEKWVKDATDKGATLECGGNRDGSRMEPTVLTNVSDDAILTYEEIFGPVVFLKKITTLDEAIEIANSVNYGLHGAIFTKDINQAHKAIDELEVGSVIINDSTDYRLDQMPFGGVKNSGIGREGIKFALQEMTEPKVVIFNIDY